VNGFALALIVGAISPAEDPALLVVRYHRVGTVFVLLGPALFLPLAVAALLASIEAARSPLLAASAFALGTWFAYLTYVALRCAAFARLQITIGRNGMLLRQGRKTRAVPWGEVGTVERHRFLQYLLVRHRDGQTLFLVEDYISGFGSLDEALRQIGHRPS